MEDKGKGWAMRYRAALAPLRGRAGARLGQGCLPLSRGGARV